MREIKFRAWDKEISRMFQLGTIESLLTDAQQPGTGEHWLTCTDHELMQYTGLKDKNGVEIYEGDVVLLQGYGNYEVEFPFLELYDAYPEGDVGKIIGNIHENPDLLES